METYLQESLKGIQQKHELPEIQWLNKETTQKCNMKNNIAFSIDKIGPKSIIPPKLLDLLHFHD